MRRRSYLRRTVGVLASLACSGHVASVGCAPPAAIQVVVNQLSGAGAIPHDRAATFHAFVPGEPAAALSGPDARWSVAADEPARVEAVDGGLLIVSHPGRRAWAVPHLPVAPLPAVPPEQVEELTWEAAVTLAERFFIVCELRFAGESGAILVQATPFDLQIFHTPDRPGGGRSESLSRRIGDGQPHAWRMRLAGGRLDILLDGSPLWSHEGPRALSLLALGESRTDAEHGGTMLVRDVVYLRRPATPG